jgi:hypothetical protein
MFTPGKYRAQPTQAEYGKASTGSDQIAITFRLLDGPEAGQHIAYFGYFTEATAEHTFEAMTNAGWDGVDLADVSMIGREGGPLVQLVIANEEDKRDGGVRSRVRYVNRVAGPVLKQKMTEGERADFAKRMRGALDNYKRKAAQATAQARPPQRQPQHETHRGDDIPF